ncbi:hypothetical protein SASPL_133593 [Salvia splendens]|uniref:PsbP C-terminal domain-containing protein n=1 Tax=Salvia splendens TaxID=180675 RepID=A0A8X8X433_SALSN|nr:hypothetical protein SASPL_133593 [Salvia splendens]
MPICLAMPNQFNRIRVPVEAQTLIGLVYTRDRELAPALDVPVTVGMWPHSWLTGLDMVYHQKLIVVKDEEVLGHRFVPIGFAAEASSNWFPDYGLAVVKQGLLAGRIPGLSQPDEQGYSLNNTTPCLCLCVSDRESIRRPWHSFMLSLLRQVPVSIDDLGGTEIDLRFASPKEGRLFVIVAPVLRFADDLGDNATIDRIGTPEVVISAFGRDVIGENVEGKVLSSQVAELEGRTYYQFELEPPHVIITATAEGNRLYLFNVTENGLQWKKHYRDLKRIADSFRVV